MRIYPADVVGLESAWHARVHGRSRAAAGDEAHLAGQAPEKIERAPRIYEGLIGREQAVRGAVVGQYVRIAQREYGDSAVAPGKMHEQFGGDGAASFIRRDLLNAMMLYMTGVFGTGNVGTQLLERV